MKNLTRILMIMLITVGSVSISFSQYSWKKQTSGTTENLLAVYFINDQIGWATGEFGTMLKTINGGLNWTKVKTPSIHELRAVHFFDQNEGIVAAYDTVYRTINGGSSWLPIWMGSTGVYFNAFFFRQHNLGWSAGQIGSLLRTHNGGINWDLLGTGESIGENDVFFVDDNNGYACGDSGSISWSRNTGLEWKGMHDYRGTKANLHAVSFGDTNTGWVAGDSGIILKTHNSGENWYKQPIGSMTNLRAIQVFDTMEGWAAGSNGLVLHTINGGTNWNTTTSQTTSHLNGMFFYSKTKGWAVGNSGTIICYSLTGNINENSPENNNFNNYPNPFCGSTTLFFKLKQAGKTRLNILNSLGQVVTTLVDEELSSGNHQFSWNASSYSPGIYFCELRTGDQAVTKRAIHLK